MGEESGISSVKGDNNNIHERIALSKLTCKMIAEKPIEGWGLSNWKVFAPAHGQVTFSPFIRLQNPHNDYLLVWSEAGYCPCYYILSFCGYPSGNPINCWVRDDAWNKNHGACGLNLTDCIFHFIFFGSLGEAGNAINVGINLSNSNLLTRYEAPETFQNSPVIINHHFIF